MRRGDLVTVSLPGDFGKPRPALVVQSDLFNETHATITVLPVTSTIIDSPIFRLTIEPTQSNGLRKISQIMIDKSMTLKRDKIGEPFGRMDDETLLRINRAMAIWLGFA